MSDKTHICVNCESNKRDMLVDLDTAGKCSICGSDSVLPAAIFLSLMDKEAKLRAAETRIKPVGQDRTLEEQKQKRIANLKDSFAPVRSFLQRNKLVDLDLWWDGWGFHTDESIQPLFLEDMPKDGEYEWSRFTLANASGEYRTITCFYDPEEEGRLSVSEIKRDFKSRK